ncbi:MAG TPA: polysaccharide deacetylase family protein [Azospira sp.]|nr:polysaccharide deacetylase family protein [Azospira sp.]
MSRPWRPTPTLAWSLAVHGAAGAGLALAPQLWPAALAAVAADHALLTVAGLLPRSRLLGPNLTRLPPEAATGGFVSLTIDDGPHPGITPRVLDLLEAADARASFFCIGDQAARQPALVREIQARGHSVENHTQRHLKRFALLGPGAMAREVAEAQDTLAQLLGRAPRFFRAVAGLRNPFLEPILARHDLHLASWTRRGYDTRSGDPALVRQRLTRNLAPGDILLLHDGNPGLTPTGRPMVLEVLPLLLADLAAAGLKSRSLEELLPAH